NGTSRRVDVLIERVHAAVGRAHLEVVVESVDVDRCILHCGPICDRRIPTTPILRPGVAGSVGPPVAVDEPVAFPKDMIQGKAEWLPAIVWKCLPVRPIYAHDARVGLAVDDLAGWPATHRVRSLGA